MSVDLTGTVRTFTCPSCGATTSFDPGTRTLRCPFCGTELAVQAQAAAVPTLTRPQYVLPFKLEKDAAATKIRDWLGGSFFAPGDLKSRSALDRGQGTYVPFWRFDSDATSHWEGEVSQTHSRQVRRSFTNAEGKSETRLVDEQYQTWHPRSGAHEGHHRTFVCASTGLTQDEADHLMPFPEEALLTYSPSLLAGFAAEEPGIDEDGARVTGEARIRELERDACAREVERLTKTDTRLTHWDAAVCYLPVWLFRYRYGGNDYRVLVNGHTGEIVGDRPVSRAKVVLTIAAVVLVLMLLIVVVAVLNR